MGVRNSYTMESTFCGSLLGQQSGLQFTPGDLESMGYCFCDTLLDYCDPDQTKVGEGEEGEGGRREGRRWAGEGWLVERWEGKGVEGWRWEVI